MWSASGKRCATRRDLLLRTPGSGLPVGPRSDMTTTRPREQVKLPITSFYPQLPLVRPAGAAAANNRHCESTLMDADQRLNNGARNLSATSGQATLDRHPTLYSQTYHGGFPSRQCHRWIPEPVSGNEVGDGQSLMSEPMVERGVSSTRRRLGDHGHRSGSGRSSPSDAYRASNRVEPLATLCGLAQGFRATVRQWAAAPRLPPELPLMAHHNSAVAANIRLLVFKIRTARSTTTPGGRIPRNRR